MLRYQWYEVGYITGGFEIEIYGTDFELLYDFKLPDRYGPDGEDDV